MMSTFDVLNEKNFVMYCAKNYSNPSCTGSEEFFGDLKRVKYIKKLITRYIETGDLKERLILNHIIVLHNCFGSTVLNKILYLKLKPQMKQVKPFLVMLNILQENIKNVGDEDIVYTDQIEMDPFIISRLRQLQNSD